jgi:hypothetical protein
MNCVRARVLARIDQFPAFLKGNSGFHNGEVVGVRPTRFEKYSVSGDEVVDCSF